MIGIPLAALAVVGSAAVVATGQTEPTPEPVELQLERVEAQVDALGAQFAVATETEQDVLFVQIAALQNTRGELCGQLSTDSDVKDLYC